MKKFLFVSYGFKTPTPEVMSAWKQWFATIKDNVVDMAGVGVGREISSAGTKELPMGPDSITGFVVVQAESFEAAERMAQANPYITSIRVYEIRSH